MKRYGALLSAAALAVVLAALLAGLAEASNCQSTCTFTSPDALNLPQVFLQPGVQSVVNLISFIAGILSVVYLILGGLRYTTSSGDTGRIKSAKETLLYAVIGLIISILAPFIVGFVVSRTP